MAENKQKSLLKSILIRLVLALARQHLKTVGRKTKASPKKMLNNSSERI